MKTFCMFSPIYKGPWTKKLLQKDSLHNRSERTLVSALAILAQRWSKIAPRKYLIYGSMQTMNADEYITIEMNPGEWKWK